MKLIIFAAIAALCSAAKLDRTYLPPASAKTAGGTPGSLQTPRQSDELPAGGFVNEAQGVVVDAAAPGTRASPGTEESGLGGPRESYGSTASKVGEAAFRESVTGFSQFPNKFSRIAPIPEHETVIGPVHGGQVFQSKTILPQASKDYNSNTLSYQNNVESHKYNYGFETDNGIAVGEKGVAHDGIHAQGGYSYKGDDGQNYKVTYTADKGGYRPQGSHLPTPPPIPEDIIKSIEQNAKEEAAGQHDDGSYSQKYNAESDYGDNSNHDQHGQFVRPGSQANGVINKSSQGSTFPAFGSVSTERPQGLNTYKPSYGSIQSGQVFPSSNTGAYGTFGSSSFGQKQGAQSNAPSAQFGLTSFGSQQTTSHTQFTHGSKPSLGSQTIKPQFGLNQPTQVSSILPSTSSTFTQFGSQSGQQSESEYNFPPSREEPTSGNNAASPTQESLFGKPSATTFGSSTFNFGQVGSSNFGNKEYLSPLGNDNSAQNVDYQKQKFGVSATPTFGSGTKPGFGSQSTQGSSATATATVSGSQSSLSNLGFGGIKRPSSVQSGQYNSKEGSSLGPSQHANVPSESIPFGTRPSKTQSSAPQFGSKPSGLSTVSQPTSTYPSQSFGLVGDQKQPQPAGFLADSEESKEGQQSQGDHNSYQYNKPEKPFISPSYSSQSTSLSAGQQISQTSNQFSSFNTHSTQILGSSKPSQTFGSVSPIPGSYQPSNTDVTQATGSSFPSAFPTPVSSFPQKVKPAQQPFSQVSQFGQKPSTHKEQSAFGQTDSLTSGNSQKTPESSQSVPSQQYTGDLYEYNTPEQGILASTPSSTPSTGGVFGQPGQGSFSQGILSSLQFGQASSGSKPVTKPQFGFTQGSQTTSLFSNKPQGFQTTQSNTPNTQSQTAFGSQSYKPFGTQFSYQGTRPQFGQTSQFGVSGTKPQFGSQISQDTSFQQQSTQQSTQGNKPSNVYLQPISVTSTLGVQGAKPQFGQESQSSQESNSQQSLQSTQQTVGSVTQQVQGSQTQYGSELSKPFGTSFQVGSQGYNPQFGQASQTQQTVGSGTQKGQGSQSQFGSYKPFGSSFNSQGTKPQFGSVPQKSQGSIFSQTQTTSQIVGTQQLSQGSQFGNRPSKPLGITQFGGQSPKPQFGSLPQSQQSSLTQTQTTQQTIGSVTSTQQQTEPQNIYLPPKPLSPTSQFGGQETKPQFGQIPSSQGSSFQQSTQTTQQTVGPLGLIGGQPSKPFDTTSQFVTQGTKPEGNYFTQSQTMQQADSSLTQQQLGQGSQIFGSQGSKPLGTTPQFGTQGTRPQGSTLTQTTQQSGSTLTQQSGQGFETFGSQSSKPFGTTSQFGTQGTKPQGSSFTETTQQSGNILTQQSGQDSQIFGSHPSKPFGTTSQFGTQGTKPQFGQVPISQGSITQTQTTQQIIGSVTGTQQPGSQTQFGSQSFGAPQIGAQGSKPQFGQTQITQQSSFTQSQLNQQSSYNKFGPSKPFTSSSPAPFSSIFGTQPGKTQSGSSSQNTQGSAGSTNSQFGSTFGQSSQGSTQFSTQTSKPFSTSHHQESKPQYGAPSKPVFGQSKDQNSQTQFGYQYEPPVNAFGKYQPKPQFGSGFTGFGSSQASSSATSFKQPFKGTQFGSQAFRPFGTQFGKNQFGQAPTSSASAFASSSSTPSPAFGSKVTLQPFGSPSTVLPASQPEFGQSSTPIGQDAYGTQSSSLASVPGSDIGVQKPFGSGVSQTSTPQPLGTKPNFGFSKPCCQSQFGQSTTVSPSFGVSSTTPSFISTPQDLNVQGSTQKPEQFSGSNHPQGFDEKTGYYY